MCEEPFDIVTEYNNNQNYKIPNFSSLNGEIANGGFVEAFIDKQMQYTYDSFYLLNPFYYSLEVDVYYETHYWGGDAFIYKCYPQANNYNRWIKNEILVRYVNSAEYKVSSLYYFADSTYYKELGIEPSDENFTGKVILYSSEDYVEDAFEFFDGVIVEDYPEIQGRGIKCFDFSKSFGERIKDLFSDLGNSLIDLLSRIFGPGSGFGGFGGSGSGGSGGGGTFGGFGGSGGNWSGSGGGGGTGNVYVRSWFDLSRIMGNYFGYSTMREFMGSGINSDCFDTYALNMQALANDPTPSRIMGLSCLITDIDESSDECYSDFTDSGHVLNNISNELIEWAMYSGSTRWCDGSVLSHLDNPICDLVRLGYSGTEINQILNFYKYCIDPGDEELIKEYGIESYDYDVCDLNELSSVIGAEHNSDLLDCLYASDPKKCMECYDAMSSFETTYGIALSAELRDVILEEIDCGEEEFEEAAMFAYLSSKLDLDDNEVCLKNNLHELQKINTFLTQHEGGHGGSDCENSEENLSYAVANAYADAMCNEGITQLDLGDIGNSSDPLWGIMKEQLWEMSKELLADVVPGGTLALLGPELFDNLDSGNWMDGMYNALEIVLNEADVCFPAAKIASLGLGLYTNSKHLRKFYDAFNKAKNLGDDVVDKLYTVLKNKLGDDIFKKFKWVNNNHGVDVLDSGDGSDIFEDLFNIFGGQDFNSDVSTGNGGELIWEFYLGGSKFQLKYHLSTSTGCWTVTISKGTFDFKMRFC